MSVKIRKKPGTGSKISLYLDIYEDGRRQYEFLNFFLYKKPKTALERQHNYETLSMAENIAAKKQISMQAGNHDLTPGFKRNINFLEYFENWLKHYPNKDLRIARYSFEHFRQFINVNGFNGKILPKDITEDLCRQFKSYLDGRLNGETPYNYFTKFKKLLKQAVKDKIILQNPVDEMDNKKQEGLKKDILSFSEIQKLAETHCGNEEVKRAFLFSLNTGLRWCDVNTITWKQIDNNKLKLSQQKTGGEVNIDLNNTALKLIGSRGKSIEKIFLLPSHTGCLKSLKQWTKIAGIDKNITWHCARHSFAVNLLWVKTDIKSVSSLLGHSGLKHTEKYTRVVDELKKTAVNNLPEINF